MRQVFRAALCSLMLLASSACSWFAGPSPLSLPHPVIDVAPFRLAFEQTASGLHFSMRCTDAGTYTDVKVEVSINGQLKVFSLGQPFGTDQEPPPPACDQGKQVLDGDIGTFSRTTGIISA
jgi:hypothetical protein